LVAWELPGALPGADCSLLGVSLALPFFVLSQPDQQTGEQLEPDPQPRRRVLFLRNPSSRKGEEQADAARESLRASGLELAEEVTGEPDRFREAVERLRNRVDVVDVIVVGGGDGTINAAAPALVGLGVPLGILPMGTANDLARSLSIPTALEDACRVIATGEEHAIDLGMVNGHYFFNAAGVGLSGEVTRKLDRERKRRWGVLSYAQAALDAWRESGVFGARMRVNGEELYIRSLQVTVGNGRHYGGGMTIAEDATIDDGLLHVYSIEPLPFLRLLGIAPLLERGSHARSDAVMLVRTQELELVTDRPVPVNADGELVGTTPARFSVLPGALRVVVPPEYAERRKEILHAAAQ
jgi:diacylglycerol kinase (ATP)